MIKGTPETGEQLFLSYNQNVIGHYAGDDRILFHDVEYSSDEAISIALQEKCEVNPSEINCDNIYWMTQEIVTISRHN